MGEPEGGSDRRERGRNGTAYAGVFVMGSHKTYSG